MQTSRNESDWRIAYDLKTAIEYHLKYSLATRAGQVSDEEIYKALALAVREYIIDAMIETENRYRQTNAKRVYYLSMEYLIGRLLGNNLINLGIMEPCRAAVEALGLDLDKILEVEYDPALGNGGLGRLAACFMDSLATLDMPGYGYGINYEFGLFRQQFDNGYQRESPDHWQAHGTPWQIERPDESCMVPLYGRLVHGNDRNGDYNPMWMDWQILIGVPHDMPVVGYKGRTVNCLRLYSAQSSDEFDMFIFNNGDYVKAVEQKIRSETVSKVLYPSDAVGAGKELRLIQEYFFVACAIRDILKNHIQSSKDFDSFPNKVAIHLNDTHPTLAIAELMRSLIDEHYLSWEKAWDITVATFAYTNHTLLPEALEKWSVELLEKVLPRHLQIIFEINHQFLRKVAQRFPNDPERLARISIIEEGTPKQVRMAHLAIVGSHSVNGVAALHTELVKSTLVPDFYALWPDKFNNKTNGITQRRWLLGANPKLSRLISGAIGERWITDLNRLRELERYQGDASFLQAMLDAKRANKQRLADYCREVSRVTLNPDSVFDIQAKRIHEYKRQLLNALHIIHLYLSIVEDGKTLDTPHTYVFAGKAAPSYFIAKRIIKLINNLGMIINDDRRANQQLSVVFIPDYKVSVAELVIPAADLSEQISTAGFEASGTGNMKFALNGALTIGTLDGANIEIRDEVGEENIYIFGLKADEVSRLRREGRYDPWDYYRRSEGCRRVLDALSSNRFCPDEPGIFQPIVDNLLRNGDYYMHLADFDAYANAQARAVDDYRNRRKWAQKALRNVARMGKFSSDRTVSEYAREIWRITRVKSGPA